MTRLRCNFVLAACLLAVLVAPAALADVAGQVISGTSGLPVEQARVGVVGEAVHSFSDGQGRFVLRGVEAPVDVVVSHSRYRPETATLEGAEGAVVTLVPKQEVFEVINVSASRSPAGQATPPTLAASIIQPADQPVAPATLTDTVRNVAGVAENGQGGLFQVYSLRGVSRQRVLTLVSGMQISGERRAGVATSFVDPLLTGDVEVVRGPASTWYGSGALGGIVELFPRRYERLHVETGYSTVGDERFVGGGWGDGAWSVALAHREADDAETPDGERLFSRYERTSAMVHRVWGGAEEGESREWELLLLPSVTRDIGKPNRDFPQRTTLYPREEHLMAKLGVTTAGGSRAYLWAHPQTLTTEAREDGALERVENESLDLGLDLQHSLELTPTLSARLGAEYYGRHGVDAFEQDFDAAGNRVATRNSLNDASLDEAAGYGSLLWRIPGATLSAGGRYTWQGQQNTGFDDVDDTAWSGFVGAAVPLPAGLQITGNVGTGLRFPSLSERFFTGTTGRGDVVANPNLDPERSLSADLGLSWFGNSLFVAGHVFRNEIDDYIERIRLPSGARTFVNLTSGTLEGVEVEGSWQMADGWSLSLGAHSIDGEDDAGRALSDVPPDRIDLTLAASPRAGLADGRLGFQVRAEARDGVDDPGSGEVAIDGAFLVEASATWELTEDLDVSLRGTNLTDETYLPTADDLAVPAPGRGVGLSLAWTR